MDARRTCVDHCLHQLKRIQDTAKASFGVRNNWRVVVDAVIDALRPLNLICPTKRIVDAIDNGRHGVDSIERLIGIHRLRRISVCSDLPTREIDRLDPSLYLLYGLTASQCAEAVHKVFRLQ